MKKHDAFVSLLRHVKSNVMTKNLGIFLKPLKINITRIDVNYVSS